MKILLSEQTVYFLQVLEIAVLVTVSCGRGSFTRICLAIELGFGNLSFEFDFLGTASKHLRPTRFWLAFRILAAFGTQQPEKEEGKKKESKLQTTTMAKCDAYQESRIFVCCCSQTNRRSCVRMVFPLPQESGDATGTPNHSCRSKKSQTWLTTHFPCRYKVYVYLYI